MENRGAANGNNLAVRPYCCRSLSSAVLEDPAANHIGQKGGSQRQELSREASSPPMPSSSPVRENPVANHIGQQRGGESATPRPRGLIFWEVAGPIRKRAPRIAGGGGVRARWWWPMVVTLVVAATWPWWWRWQSTMLPTSKAMARPDAAAVLEYPCCQIILNNKGAANGNKSTARPYRCRSRRAPRS